MTRHTPNQLKCIVKVHELLSKDYTSNKYSVYENPKNRVRILV